ncbi:hypothetical protein, partial [Streptosporangium vulgare]|uniref:hypothetical protein n=1 Tax=Streptosporangium vulgare TaxID=46190 RepID=UPI0031D8CC77
WPGTRRAACVRAATGPGLSALLAVALPWTRAGPGADTEVADWGADPWSRGAFNAPAASAPSGLPAVWAEPVADTLFFAGRGHGLAERDRRGFRGRSPAGRSPPTGPEAMG